MTPEKDVCGIQGLAFCTCGLHIVTIHAVDLLSPTMDGPVLAQEIPQAKQAILTIDQIK